jgi:EAP30/Vps36 family
MKQAGEMVALAESFNRSLMEHDAQRKALPEDAQFIIGSSMARLGLVGPTPAAATSENGKEEKWLADLTKELAAVLTGSSGNGGLMKARGMIALDEVWGAWNRARGVGECLCKKKVLHSLTSFTSSYTAFNLHASVALITTIHESTNPHTSLPLQLESRTYSMVCTTCLFVTVTFTPGGNRAKDYGTGCAAGEYRCRAGGGDDWQCGEGRQGGSGRGSRGVEWEGVTVVAQLFRGICVGWGLSLACALDMPQSLHLILVYSVYVSYFPSDTHACDSLLLQPHM